MLVGKNKDPRIFMKYGHSDPEKKIAYTRIAPPPGAMTKDLIDLAVDKTMRPVFEMAGENVSE